MQKCMHRSLKQDVVLNLSSCQSITQCIHGEDKLLLRLVGNPSPTLVDIPAQSRDSDDVSSLEGAWACVLEHMIGSSDDV